MVVRQMVEALTPCVQAPWELPIREWRKSNSGPVVGCFPVYSPVELVHASGGLPLGIFGGGTEVEMLNADARFVSFVCSIAKSTLELGLQSRLDGLDAVFFHSICDVARNLSAVFARNFPNLWVEYIHLPQNPACAGAVDYYAAELRRVCDKLQQRFGSRITEDTLRQSIAVYNEARALLQNLYTLRERDPERLPTRELNALTRAFTCQPVEASIEQLRRVAAYLPTRQPVRRDRVRVLLEGAFCEQPPFELLETIEEAGAQIVEDDLVKGWRWFRGPIPTDGDPLRALAESYLHRSLPSSVRHDWTNRRENLLVRRVRECGAQAVLFCVAKFCEPALFDYVPYKDALDSEGIPHLLIEYEEKMWTFERIRDEIETFVESILFD